MIIGNEGHKEQEGLKELGPGRNMGVDVLHPRAVSTRCPLGRESIFVEGQVWNHAVRGVSPGAVYLYKKWVVSAKCHASFE